MNANGVPSRVMGTRRAIPACMLMPSISRYMTRQPWTIRSNAKLVQARELMREHAIRHLPVLDGGKLVGIVSERDLFQYARLNLIDHDLTVEDAMTADVFVAQADDAVDKVVERMAERKYGAAVVLDRRGSVEGIFTTVDGMQALADVLRRATA
jgi:acetoin utilization protein AcuB